MSVGKYLPGASFSIFAVKDDVIKCKMNSYWFTLLLKVRLAPPPPPIIDKKNVLNARHCSANCYAVIELLIESVKSSKLTGIDLIY